VEDKTKYLTKVLFNKRKRTKLAGMDVFLQAYCGFFDTEPHYGIYAEIPQIHEGFYLWNESRLEDYLGINQPYKALIWAVGKEGFGEMSEEGINSFVEDYLKDLVIPTLEELLES